MIFTLAHFSDLHLGPLPARAAFHAFRPKRVLGALSWHLKRKKIHRTEVAEALMGDIKAARPDHIVFTGDAANVASPLEFPALRRWMERLADPRQMSYVPGNHDAYVQVPYEKSLAYFEPYMTGDMRLADPFPYVRLRRNIALIGLNSAIPRPFHSAEGMLGPGQIHILAELLAELRARGFYRAVMIHHPPVPGLAQRRRSLIDAQGLRDVLVEHGAELVIYGHNHRREFNVIEGAAGPIPLVAVPSASMNGNHGAPAEWNLYRIERQNRSWRTSVSIRQWNKAGATFAPAGEFEVGLS